MADVEREAAVALGAGGKNVKTGRDHFRSDAVAADRGDPVGTHRFGHGLGLVAEVQPAHHNDLSAGAGDSEVVVVDQDQ